MKSTAVTLEKLVALCKRRGFIYQSAEIYGGLNGVYDYGHLGTLMKQNIKKAWTDSLKSKDLDILFLDGAILGAHSVWKASGHIENFHDPMVDCLVCKHRYRTDDIDLQKACPHCGNTNWSAVRQFNMMFSTQLGATSEQSSLAYLRPETAQTIFINFKNVMATNRVKIPFGIAQIGKAFRNEITPKQFLFRMREFEQMELEWFCRGEDALKFFEFWCDERLKFYQTIGINPDHAHLRNHEAAELSHYSSATSDIEYQFPFGFKELEGIAYRTDFDLKQHSSHSGKDLAVFDEQTKSSYIPHVVETSVGVDRLFLTLLFESYQEDVVDGEERISLRLHPRIAPITAAIFPLTKKQEEIAHKIYLDLKRKGYSVLYDDGGSIGKRYRRQDEIGTPACFTIDFDTESTHTITVRNRDTMAQERINLDSLENYISTLLQS